MQGAHSVNAHIVSIVFCYAMMFSYFNCIVFTFLVILLYYVGRFNRAKKAAIIV